MKRSFTEGWWRMLDAGRLRLLRELQQRGTITAVAQVLAYSPSAVSQQLRVLEKEVGAPLLEPSGRRVQLTTQGQILAAHADAVIAQLERAEAEVAASLHRATGTVRVALFQTAAQALLPGALAMLAADHPDLRVEASQREPEDALAALAAHDFDLVVIEEYPDSPEPQLPGTERELLYLDPLRLVLPPTLPAPASVAALADHPWVMEPASTPAGRWARALCRHAGFEPDVRYRSTDLLLHLRLVSSGHAVAVLPDLVDRRHTAVHQADLPDAPVRRVDTVVRRGAAGHPAVRAVRDALRASLPGGGGGPRSEGS